MKGKIPVNYFQGKAFARKEYLFEIKYSSVSLLEKMGMSKMDQNSFEIHLCQGYIHNETGVFLKEQGFQVVRTEIKEPLQSLLEEAYRQYVKQISGQDVYYEPKMMSQHEIATAYYKTISFIDSNDMWSFAKTGWGSLKRYKKYASSKR